MIGIDSWIPSWTGPSEPAAKPYEVSEALVAMLNVTSNLWDFLLGGCRLIIWGTGNGSASVATQVPV